MDPENAAGAIEFDNGQADAVEGNGAFGYDAVEEGGGGTDEQDAVGTGMVAGDEGAGAVDVAADEMAAERIARAEGTFEVEGGADGTGGEGGTVEGLAEDVEVEAAGGVGDEREADAVDGDAFADVGGWELGAHGEAGGAAMVGDAFETPQLLDKSGEHGVRGWVRRVRRGGGSGRSGENRPLCG